MYPTISIHEDGPVGSILLNRPEARNAINAQLASDLAAAARHFDAQKHVKVVMISGAGSSFCAGGDVLEFAEMPDASSMRRTVDAGRRMSQAIAAMRAITVAQVRGNCLGGGLALMMACDFRYASVSAQFRLPEADLGLPFAWGGAAWLAREIGPLLAIELILTGRELSGADAAAYGLVNSAVPEEDLNDLVNQQVRTLSSRPVIILEVAKAQIAAAKQSLCSDAYAYSDSHVLHTALTDPESMQVRERYLADISGRPVQAKSGRL